MTDEITKLYENAGIKPTKNWQSCLNCKLKTETRYDEWGEEYLTCDKLERPEDCSDAKEYYPPFTAEKQLELLKICFDKYERLEKVRGLKERCIIYHHFEKDYTEFVNCETWEETIAGLINNLWQDLTENERKQIKEILE